ncbi:MAG: hypothetical protein ACRD25_10520 [Terracidiphilus sp.]
MPIENVPKSRRLHAIAIAVVGIAAPLALFAIGMGHVFWHEKVTLDWQAVTLLITGVLLFFLPLREIAAKLLKLKIGKFELELQKDTEALSEKVDEAEAESAEDDDDDDDTDDEASDGEGTSEDEKSDQPTRSKDKEKDGADAVPTRAATSDLPRWSKRPRHYQVDFDEVTSLRYEVDQLQSISPKAGLIRVASALEQTMLKMATPLKPPQKLRVRSFSMALDLLYRSGMLTPSLASALSQFWTLRNKIIHQSAPIEEISVLPAIDDGFRLLAILKNLGSIEDT